MENRKMVKGSRLDGWFMKMDGLDRDDVGLLDKRVTSCFDDFRRRNSAFYGRLEVTGEDPHEQMLVLGGPGAGAPLLSKMTRTCFGPGNCSCEEDATPWEDFYLKPSDLKAHSSTEVVSDAGATQVDDVGIIDIKRQMGFQELSREEENEDAAALARDAAELARRRKPRGGNSAVPGGENGSKPTPQINAVMVVRNGSHLINLSGVGFHSANDLQDVVDVFTSPGLPPVKELDVSNGFFNTASFQVLCRLLQIPHIRQSLETLILRGIAVPQSTDFAALMRVLTGNSGCEMSCLKTLDLSFNTLGYEGALQLKPLLGSLQRLDNLSLKSCFSASASPTVSHSSVIDQKNYMNSVRTAFVEISNRLESINFGSNFVPTESCWLDALLTQGNTLQEVSLCDMNSFSFSIADNAESMEVDWQVGETWDLQQVEIFKWSSRSIALSDKLLDALSVDLQSGFSQLKCLDMEIFISATDEEEGNATKKFADTINRIADYAVLRSCRVCCYSSGTISPGLRSCLGRLLEDGLHECEVLSLRMPQLFLSPSAISDLMSGAAVSKTKKMTLAVGITSGDQFAEKAGSYFLQMQSMRELTLELHVTGEAQDNACAATAVALARQLEASWLASNSCSLAHDDKRLHGDKNGKATRSFVLSEQQKANKKIYRCRFLTTPKA
ncbi:unnamed protein product [Phytophthora lilii]|uniref:Unnamed protein product n=1 Tax=Phytophthora lilii TaxID=2077276 RepID=A0A9W6TXW0_9STRA|nr:unnamed protein product [Phytophthora lilii]